MGPVKTPTTTATLVDTNTITRDIAYSSDWPFGANSAVPDANTGNRPNERVCPLSGHIDSGTRRVHVKVTL
ncbi:DNA-cytosine methyltransferase [Mycolicibacterium brisbanense]|uniref:DNA-cytosine methyltransferase n=1 Tax=Mycolicibacterium brisbanense TaxID=146020 RepID=A0A117I6A5_9MYCO|nr:DNA-cytosine methyltransferase [Mycolicibacterium brisbanense]